jgi:uncharacterized protein YjbJ (UPF0337 family)
MAEEAVGDVKNKLKESAGELTDGLGQQVTGKVKELTDNVSGSVTEKMKGLLDKDAS